MRPGCGESLQASVVCDVQLGTVGSYADLRAYPINKGVHGAKGADRPGTKHG